MIYNNIENAQDFATVFYALNTNTNLDRFETNSIVLLSKLYEYYNNNETSFINIKGVLNEWEEYSLFEMISDYSNFETRDSDTVVYDTEGDELPLEEALKAMKSYLTFIQINKDTFLVKV